MTLRSTYTSASDLSHAETELRRLREESRLRALDELDLLDSEREPEYDDLVRLASKLCGTPISLVSLVDDQRQWFKAAVGLNTRETPRSLSFCSHAIEQDGVFVVEDAEQDVRFANNSLVTGDPGIRFYAGVPLHAEDRSALGTLCVLDIKPRTLSAAEREALTILAHQVQSHFMLRLRLKRLEETVSENRRLMAHLEVSRDTFRAFMNNGPFAGYIKDKAGRMIFYNRTLAETFGVDQQQWTGKSDHEIWPTEHAERFRRTDVEVLSRREPVEAMETSPGADGSTIHWKSYKFPIRQETGEWMLGGISIDITAEQTRERQLQDALSAREEACRELEAHRRMLCAFDDQVPHLAYIKCDGRYISYNHAFADFFGIEMTTWIGRHEEEVHTPAMVQTIKAQEHAVLSAARRIESCDHVTTASGRQAVLHVARFPLQGRHDERLVGGVAFDITEEVNRQRAMTDSNIRLQELATTDALTGLCVRRVFDQRLEAAYNASETGNVPLSLIVLDVDNFKLRNDRFGHAAGDEALRCLGQILYAALRRDDLAARIGGEEFALLLPETAAEEALTVAQRIRNALVLAPCEHGAITVSMGVASRQPATRGAKRLLNCADDAMYEAKRAGKDCIVPYRDHQAELLQQAAAEAAAAAAAAAEAAAETATSAAALHDAAVGS